MKTMIKCISFLILINFLFVFSACSLFKKSNSTNKVKDRIDKNQRIKERKGNTTCPDGKC